VLIQEWIAELGADQYARRERAQAELRRLGVAAFDALIEAQHHDDIEVALRARYLVRSLPIRWSVRGDTVEVKSLLRNYVEANRTERRSRMQQLANLSDSAGLEALCRLVRYETDELLSKEAALLAIQHAKPDGPDRRSALSERVEAAIGGSRRPGAAWMRAYAQTLRDPASSLETWEQITRSEVAALHEMPQKTHRELVRDLLRWQADLLSELRRNEDSVAVIRRTLDLVHPDREELFDVVDWAMERSVWTVVAEVAERFHDEFYKDAGLVYRLAEAQLKQGDAPLAAQTAQQALALNPGYRQLHVETAMQLMIRQQYEWTENELRQVVSTSEKEDDVTLEARYRLADMLFDLGRNRDAADVMREAVAAMDKDPKLLQQTPRLISSVRGQLHYYASQYYMKIGDHEKQARELQEAIKYDRHQPDYIIAMYRIPDRDDAWRDATMQLLSDAEKLLRDKIVRVEAVLRNPRTEVEHGHAELEAARLYNEFAWLISNTEGELQYALRCSRKSVEIDPASAAFLDTLGRCYYAVGDLQNAVKHQRMAVEQAPYYQQIRRQLEFFEKAVQEQEAS